MYKYIKEIMQEMKDMSGIKKLWFIILYVSLVQQVI